MFGLKTRAASREKTSCGSRRQLCRNHASWQKGHAGAMQEKGGRSIGLLASLLWQLGWPNGPWFGSSFSLSLGLIRGKQNGLQEWTSINSAQKQKLQDNLKINKITIMTKNYV